MRHAFLILLPLCVTISTSAQPPPQRLYAGLVNSKSYVAGAPLKPSGLYVYISDTTWQLIGWKHPRVSAVTKDPHNPDIIYLACGNGCLKSEDGGKTWKITTDWRVTEAQSISVDTHAPEHVYIATAYGIWRSADFGESWIEANAGLERKYTQVIRADRGQAGRLFAGTESGIFCTENGGRRWQRTGPAAVSILALAQSRSNTAFWLAGSQEDGVWISRDGGKTWDRPENAALGRSSIYTVAIDPFDARNCAAAGWDTGVWLSRDGGNTWHRHATGLPVDDIYALAFDANVPGRLWAATVEAGIFASADFGESWQFRGMYGSLVFDLEFLPGETR